MKDDQVSIGFRGFNFRIYGAIFGKPKGLHKAMRKFRFMSATLWACACVIAAALVATKTSAHDQSIQSVAHTNERSGKTAVSQPDIDGNAFWSNILTLITAHGGYITLNDFESTFRTRLGHHSSNERLDTYYAVEGSDWYSRIDYGLYHKRFVRNGQVINPGGTMTSFNISWPTKLRSGEWCVNANTAIDELVRSGWTSTEHLSVDGKSEYAAPNNLTLSNPKTKSLITVFYGEVMHRSPPGIAISPRDACVSEIEVTGHPGG